MSEKKINIIGKDLDRDSVKFLFIFKIIKQHVQMELKREGKEQPYESILNETCANATNEILSNLQGKPTKEQVSQAVLNAKRKLALKTNYNGSLR